MEFLRKFLPERAFLGEWGTSSTTVEAESGAVATDVVARVADKPIDPAIAAPTPTPIVAPFDYQQAEGHDAPTNDESLLVAQARNDSTAFGLLYQRYVDRVYAYIYHRVGNEQDAEDLTARTFYRALDKLDTYEDRGLPFGAWLFRIAHNLVANWHRDHSRRSFISLDRLWSAWKDDDDPVRAAEQGEENGALWNAIERLPKERRELLRYKFSSQLSNLEIGELMNKSESAIKSLYFRTLATLRSELETKGWGADRIENAQEQ